MPWALRIRLRRPPPRSQVVRRSERDARVLKWVRLPVPFSLSTHPPSFAQKTRASLRSSLRTPRTAAVYTHRSFVLVISVHDKSIPASGQGLRELFRAQLFKPGRDFNPADPDSGSALTDLAYCSRTNKAARAPHTPGAAREEDCRS